MKIKQVFELLLVNLIVFGSYYLIRNYLLDIEVVSQYEIWLVGIVGGFAGLLSYYTVWRHVKL